MDANLTPYRIAHVVGARPQFVKLKPLAAAIADAGGMNWVAHTGQHYDVLMNDSFWVEMGFRPDYHGAWTRESADLEHLVDALRKARADAVVVYGDTDSTVLGAKAALELGLPLAHAEAGLRSFNALMPEEHNRVWVDQRAISDILSVEINKLFCHFFFNFFICNFFFKRSLHHDPGTFTS